MLLSGTDHASFSPHPSLFVALAFERGADDEQHAPSLRCARGRVERLRRLNMSLAADKGSCWLLDADAAPGPLLRSALAGWSVASSTAARPSPPPPPSLLLLPPASLRGLRGCELVEEGQPLASGTGWGYAAHNASVEAPPPPVRRLALMPPPAPSPLLSLRVARRLAAVLSHQARLSHHQDLDLEASSLSHEAGGASPAAPQRRVARPRRATSSTPSCALPLGQSAARHPIQATELVDANTAPGL